MEPEQDFHFRARPMPNFTSRPPTTITTSDVTRKLLTTPMPFNFHTDQRATRQPVGTKETFEQRQSRARPMPNLGKSPTAVPPRYLSPQKSPSNTLRHEKLMEEKKVGTMAEPPFRARQLPDFFTLFHTNRLTLRL